MDKKVANLLKSRREEVIKIDLGGGLAPQPGFIVMDPRPLRGVDIVHDLEKYPWPLPNSSVGLLMASNMIHRINPANQGFIKWMNEAWRVLKVGAQIMISVPYAGSTPFWTDPTSLNAVTAQTWFYFDPLHESGLWNTYRPKPWKIEKVLWQAEGAMEVLLSKRREDDLIVKL